MENKVLQDYKLCGCKNYFSWGLFFRGHIYKIADAATTITTTTTTFNMSYNHVVWK